MSRELASDTKLTVMLNTELNSETLIQKATEKPENWSKQKSRKLHKERVKFYN